MRRAFPDAYQDYIDVGEAEGRKEGKEGEGVNKGSNSIMCVYECGDTCYAPRAIVTPRRRFKKDVVESIGSTLRRPQSTAASHFHRFSAF